MGPLPVLAYWLCSGTSIGVVVYVVESGVNVGTETGAGDGAGADVGSWRRFQRPRIAA